MTEWIIPCNPKLYRIEDAFKDLKIIDWRKTNNIKSAQDGDIVYIYISSPVSQIAYKGAIINAHKEHSTIDDSSYLTTSEGTEIGECMEIAVFREYEMDGLDINTLKENGLKSNLMGPVKVNPELANYLHACDNAQRNSDRFLGSIPGVCTVPFPIKIFENGIDKNIPLSPIKVSEDEIIVCRACNQEFRKAKRCTLCGQLIRYPNETKYEKQDGDLKDTGFEANGINSGKGLYNFLEKSGILGLSPNALESSQNYIIVKPGNVSFNWKASQGLVRVNCKKYEMEWIVQKTGYKPILNGANDPRPYSFLLNSFEKLKNVVLLVKFLQDNE